MGTREQDNPSPTWRIEMFGGLRVLNDGRPIERFQTQKIGALLALLALAPGRQQTREKLVDALWPDALLSAGRDSLSQALVWLRPRLEPDDVARGSVLVTDRVTVGLAPDKLTTDVSDFEAALDTVRQAKTTTARQEALKRAVALYQGELLPDSYGDWVFPIRRRMHASYLNALRQLANSFEQAGDPVQAIEYLRRALMADALDEEAHGDLIRLLAASGQVTAALRHFQELTQLFADELGTEPSPAIAAQVDQIRHTKPLPLAVHAPPHWPKPITRFFGREAEVAEIRRLVTEDEARLITLTGTGGAGKTRLALSTDLKDIYQGANAFVALADLRDAEMIPGAIADALRLPSAVNTPLEQVIMALAGRPWLLVLDNLEHLHPNAGPVIGEMLERLPSLTILVTSRQRLGLDGEHELPVTSLPHPDPSGPPDEIDASASVRLFVDRARLVRPGFALSPENAEVIALLCARLDGIPLAIELCAAWAQTLTPAQMLEKLTRRFDLLVSRRTDITPRHRTLRAALEYSYLQLPSNLQRLFSRLSVFRGGWTLEAAEEVGEDGSLLSPLTELRERSLIVADEIKDGGIAQMRYRILDTLREFAWEQLSYAERNMRRNAHTKYYLALAEQAGTAEGPWAARLALEQENMRAALAWCLEAHDAQRGLRLGAALCAYWSVRGPLREGQDWLQSLLDMAAEDLDTGPAVSDRIWADAWSALGQLAWAQGAYPTALNAHQKALALRRRTGEGVAETLYHLGITAYRYDDYDSAQEYLQESLTLAQQQGDVAGIARVLLNLGNIAYEQQDHAQARIFFQESLTLAEAQGNRQRIANACNNLGLTALAEADYAQASLRFHQALTLYRELTDHYGIAMSLINYGAVRRLQHRWQEAHDLLNEGLTLAREVGNRHAMAFYLQEFGLLASAEGDSARALPLLAASQSLFHLLGSLPGNGSSDVYQQALADAKADLDPETYDTLWLQGLSLPPEQIVSQLLKK